MAQSSYALSPTIEAKSCAGLRGTFLSPDRKVDAGQCAWNPTESRFIRSLCCTKSHPDKNVGIG